MSTKNEEIDIDLLLRVADKLKEKAGWGLFGSKWGKAEAEVIADQTIRASASNYREKGCAFSWAALMHNSGNQEGLRLLGDALILETYCGPHTPKHPDSVMQEDGKYMVFRVTPKLLEYAADFLGLA